MFAGNYPIRSSWQPSNNETLAWYDAADDSTFTITNGLVSEWRDKSGNSYHQRNDAQPTNRPARIASILNGKSVVRFTGDVLESLFTPVSSFTLGIVYKKNGKPSNPYNNAGFIFDIGVVLAQDPTGRILQMSTSDAARSIVSRRLSSTAVSALGDNYNWEVGIVQLNVATGLKYFVDRENIGEISFNGSAPPGTPSIRLGNGSTWSATLNTIIASDLGFVGDIAELVILPGEFPANKLTSYFSRKWNLGI